MNNSITPNLLSHAQHIIKNVIGTKTFIKSFEWSSGGLFNKTFKINTTDGDFILKIECDRIFFSTRKEQIENEVFGNELFKKAGIPCADILAFDFTKNDIDMRYILMEHIRNETNDAPLLGDWNNFNEITKSEINRQFNIAVEKMRNITNSHFGSLSPSGILGRHETYDNYYLSTLNLLINDSENLEIFTNEELDIVKNAARIPLICTQKYVPTFVHGDLGFHNSMWGNTKAGEDMLYVIDFGNAFYGLPYFDEYKGNINPGILNDMNIDKNIYDCNLIVDFERMFWRETERLTEDYFYCRDWMISNIEAAKKDTSRSHILHFVDTCKKFTDNLSAGGYVVSFDN